jgi:hypothetical protein
MANARKRITKSDADRFVQSNGMYMRYKLLAESLFKWSGLPQGVEERHIEEYLFEFGQALFFRDPKMSYMCLQAQNGVNLNVYADPLTYRAVGINYNKEYKAGHDPEYAVFAAQHANALSEGIIIRNNAHSISTKTLIMPYLITLEKIQTVMDINIETCKMPFIIECTPKNELSMKSLFRNLIDGVYALFVNKNMDISKNLNVIQTGAKFMGNEMLDYKHIVESDLLTMLGIDNVNVSKRERLITEEVSANDKLIDSFVDIALKSRQAACTAINETFGLDVSVAFRNPVDNPGNPIESSEEDESNDSGI